LKSLAVTGCVLRLSPESGLPLTAPSSAAGAFQSAAKAATVEIAESQTVKVEIQKIAVKLPSFLIHYSQCIH
jgi:hypothetical protein